MTAKLVHPTREAWLNAFVDAARPKFKAIGNPLPKKVRVSIGFCSTGKKGKRIGECWSAMSAKDGVSEIFIVPSLQDSPSRIADILTHELIHAHGIMDHGKGFRKIALALGLEGKMTATVAGKDWHVWADPIVKALGRFPGAALGGGAELVGGPKKQKNRQLKLECDECGWTCRTPAANIQGYALHCPDSENCNGALQRA